MELQTISQVSKSFQISTRALRYYEQLGLIKSVKKEDYAYRTYDETSLAVIRQIVILRKLQIPLKQISVILNDENISAALDVFTKKADELQSEIKALSTIKAILDSFIDKLKSSNISVKSNLLSDKILQELSETLTVTRTTLREEKSMNELNRAEEELSRLNDVRIVYLPPATVAASHYIGDNPEDNAGEVLNNFIKSTQLYKIKPDMRHYGFNHPNPTETNPVYGYEMWVTIPDDMEVPAPLVKKHFNGGLYAAHMIKFGNFHEWAWLDEWVRNSDKYEAAPSPEGSEVMFGCLEETLNYVNRVQTDAGLEDLQLDLMIPVKEKQR
jgi:DNA-binding transcriptional MerR regulator